MTDDTALRATLLDLEERFWLEGGGNPGFWREHAADDAVVVLPIGILTKQDTVAAMEQSPGWSGVELDELYLRRLSPDCALLAYRARARGADDRTYAATVSTVYRREAGTWRLAFHQQSPAA